MNTATTVPKARNGPNGTAVLRPARPTAIIATPTDRAGEEAQEQSDGDQTRIEPSEVGAEQRRQTYVAVAHAAAAGDVHDPHERKRAASAQQHRPHPTWLVADERGETSSGMPTAAVT